MNFLLPTIPFFAVLFANPVIGMTCENWNEVIYEVMTNDYLNHYDRQSILSSTLPLIPPECFEEEAEEVGRAAD